MASLNYTTYDYISYEELLKVMCSSANQFGMVPAEAKIEILLGEEYLPFEEKLVTSNYRLLYKFYSKSGYVDGYVYMNLTVNVIELEYTATEMMTLDALKDLFLEHITLNETSKLEMYDLENEEYVAFDETLDLVTGKYRCSYVAKEIVGENEVEYAAYAYLDLTLPAQEVEEEIIEEEEEEDFGGFGDLFE